MFKPLELAVPTVSTSSVSAEDLRSSSPTGTSIRTQCKWPVHKYTCTWTFILSVHIYTCTARGGMIAQSNHLFVCATILVLQMCWVEHHLSPFVSQKSVTVYAPHKLECRGRADKIRFFTFVTFEVGHVSPRLILHRAICIITLMHTSLKAK